MTREDKISEKADVSHSNPAGGGNAAISCLPAAKNHKDEEDDNALIISSIPQEGAPLPLFLL